MAWNENGNDNITAASGWLGTAVARPLIIATENPGGTQDLPDPAAEVMRITAAAQGRRIGIGTPAPQRRLHVEPTEIHSGGSGAGLSFGNRQTAAFVEGPANGERWVWYATGGTARLWSGTDKLSVAPNGNFVIGTTNPENAEGWSRVLDVLGGPTTKLSIRTGPPGNIDARVLAHGLGWAGAPPGMIIGTRTPHPLSFYTNNLNRMTITADGSIRWANNSAELNADQGGSIELGGNGATLGGGTPYIDFHFGPGRVEDFNTRLINNDDGLLTYVANPVAGFRRFRLDPQDGTGRILDLRIDGAQLDIQTGGGWDLFINNSAQRVYIRNLRTGISSRAMKENIADLSVHEAIEALDGLNPVRFNWIDDEEKRVNLGFVAEDTPESVAPEGTGIAPMHLLAILTKVVQEQQRTISSMRRELGQQDAT